MPDSLGWALLAAGLALGAAEWIWADEDAISAVLASVAVTAFFLIAMPWLILRWAKRSEWFNRTLLALAAVDLASAVLALPGYRFAAYEEGYEGAPDWWIWPVLVWLLVLIAWTITVKVRIWRQATSRSAMACLALVSVLWVVEIAVQFSLPA